MLDIFSVIINHWPILAGLFILTVIVLGFLVPAIGRQLVIPAIAAAGAIVAYWSGRRNERKAQNKRVQRVNKKREEAYDEIDRRGTDRDDVADRLRKHDF